MPRHFVRDFTVEDGDFKKMALLPLRRYYRPASGRNVPNVHVRAYSYLECYRLLRCVVGSLQSLRPGLSVTT